MNGGAEPRNRGERIRNAVGLIILAAAFIWSVVWVAYQAFYVAGDTTITGDKRIIRFVHWQLEGGIVDALEDACELYEQLHPDVDVQQIEVPERAYKQWVRTQLVGRTAPDLIESRFSDNMISRYFLPITNRVGQPNPYNSREWDRKLVELLGGDPSQAQDLGKLEGVPWRDTYVDNMEGGFRWQLQDYYFMPLSVFTIRIFANRDLLETVAGDLLRNPETGEIEGPTDLSTFFDVCERIKAYRGEKGERYIPIAGSDYVAEVFNGRYRTMCTWNLRDELDLNEDGTVSNGERLLVTGRGDVDLATDPTIDAHHKLMYRICRQFNPGFMNAKREDSVFMFAQGKAVMMATGSWEAGTMQQQVSGMFDIMVFDFPIPKPGQPYSDIIHDRPSEAGEKSGFPMALTRFSKYPEVAVDFMQFLSSRRINEWLNGRFRWFPAVRGARVDPVLEAFKPKVVGIYSVFKYDFEGTTSLAYKQQFQSFVLTNPDPDVPFEEFLDGHYRDFIQGFVKDYNKYAVPDFRKLQDDSYSAAAQTEMLLAQARARVMRQGLTPRNRRDLVSLVWGQVRRIIERSQGAAYLEEAEEAFAEKRRPVE